jgi:hypothetical protein
MATCQYYLKQTKTPRICAKKSTHNKSSFLGGVCQDQIPEFDLHLCHNHFGMIANQIRKKIGVGSLIDFQQGIHGMGLFVHSNTWEWELAQLVSILTHRIEEFNRVTRASHRPEGFAGPSGRVAIPLRGVSCPIVCDDDVLFIEEKNEIEVLARKFEEAKRDGRYIDLTVLIEQKSEPEWDRSVVNVERKIDCPVCLDKFSSQNITFLRCAHPVCNECLSNIAKHNIQQCPVCRHAL